LTLKKHIKYLNRIYWVSEINLKQIKKEREMEKREKKLFRITYLVSFRYANNEQVFQFDEEVYVENVFSETLNKLAAEKKKQLEEPLGFPDNFYVTVSVIQGAKEQ
jgi:hypothetical protein